MAEFNEFGDMGPVDELERHTEVQGLVAEALESAMDHFESEIEPDLVDATDYYHGEPFDDDGDLSGRSSVVSTDVRDATLSQLPSLMRIFFGSSDAVEYRPREQEDIPKARQQTDYVNFIVREDNDGFAQFHSLFKDALVRRLGVAKWWWDTFHRVEATSFSGLTEQEVLPLLMEEEVEDVEITGVTPANPATGVPETFDLRITRKEKDGRVRFAAIPREEFVYTPYARDLETAGVVAHVREVPADELIAMGIDEDIVMDHVERAESEDDDSLETSRQMDDAGWNRRTKMALDESQLPVTFAEAYMRVDGDGDGIGELRKFLCIGDDFEIVNGDGLGEIVDEIPFAVFCPDPEPHTIEGLSNFDLLRDVQKIKSHVQRATLNSLAAAVEPVTEVVVGEVNIGDLVSPDINKIVRVNKPGMMREVSHMFVGKDTLPVLEYMDSVKEDRTGLSKAAAGLDADSLQSSTKAAVAATLSASQQRIEMIARIFAETGMKRLFRGLLRLVVQNQNRARVVRLRNEYVEIDPTDWDADMDVAVNIALGQGPTEEKVAVYAQLAEKMEMHIQQGSPLFTFANLRNVYAKILESVGESEVSAFIQPFGEEEMAQFQQAMAQQEEEPDPQMMLVELEQMRVQMEKMKMEHDRQLEWFKARREDDRERDKLAQERALKEAEIEAKYSVEILKLEQDIEIARAQMEQAVDGQMRGDNG